MRIIEAASKTYLLEDEGEGGVVAADASNGRLEREEAVLLHSRGDLAGESTRVLRFVADEDNRDNDKDKDVIFRGQNNQIQSKRKAMHMSWR